MNLLRVGRSQVSQHFTRLRVEKLHQVFGAGNRHFLAVASESDCPAGTAGQVALDNQAGSPTAALPKTIFLSAASHQPAAIRTERQDPGTHVSKFFERLAIRRVEHERAGPPKTHGYPTFVGTDEDV